MDNQCVIFTVDTESDNQWGINNYQTTENAKYIPRFQTMCENYGIIPVYLVDYSMSNSKFLVDYLNTKLSQKKCEVGCHIHAWDTPPSHKYDLSEKGRPYLNEYPTEIKIEKISNITKHLRERFDSPIVSHRAGRWAMDDDYFQILNSFGYMTDCSFTPGINWDRQIGYEMGGSDYSAYRCEPIAIPDTDILEVPMTIAKLHCFTWDKKTTITANTKRFIKSILGRNIWLRPALNSEYEMERLIEHSVKSKMQYIEFMIHSSELMPSGSPYFKNTSDIDVLYEVLEKVFRFIAEIGFKGISLNDFQERYRR